MMSKKPQKPHTTLGMTRISAGPDGHEARYIDDSIPTDKEDRELHFAGRFVEKYNSDYVPTPEAAILSFTQNDTSDLDFDLECGVADYLELAAIKPLSERFGQEIAATGKIDILQLGEWIYESLIVGKQSKYGELSGRVILLLYPEDWQFILSDSVLWCLAGLCRTRGTKFAGVFTIGGPPGLDLVAMISPNHGDVPDPESFAGKHYWNLPPGKHEHKIDLK